MSPFDNTQQQISYIVMYVADEGSDNGHLTIYRHT